MMYYKEMQCVITCKKYVLNKVCFSRNKTMYYWSVYETVMTRGLQEPNPVFPFGLTGLVVYFSVFVVFCRP